MKSIPVLTIAITLAIISCSKESMYSTNLKDPQIVADGYIKSVLYGDTKYTLYYSSGEWKAVNKIGIPGGLLEARSKEKASRRLVELFSWSIEKRNQTHDAVSYNIALIHPNEKYLSKRMDELLGNHYEGNVYVSGANMTEDEARNIIRHEKNLPMQTDKFTIRLKKNQYGWVVDGLDDGVSELTSFLNNS